MEQSLKEKLDRNIWITRKCRINASERLLSHAKYIEIYRLKANSTDSTFTLSNVEKCNYYCQLVWEHIWRAGLILLPIIAAGLYFFLR